MLYRKNQSIPRPAMNNINNIPNITQKKLDLLDIPINVLAFLYIEAVFILVAWEGLSRFCLGLAFMLAIVVAIQTLSKGGRLPALIFLPWLFFAFCVLSMMWATDLDAAFQSVGSTFSSILGGTAIWQARNLGLSWKTIAWAVIVGSFILIASARAEVAVSGIEGRAAGMVLNPNVFAMYLSFSAFLIWTAPQKMPKWMHLLGVFFLFYGIAYSGSRKSLLVLAVAVFGAIVWALFRIKKPSTWVMLASGVILSILLLGYIQSHNVNVEEQLTSFSSVSRMMRFFTGKQSGEETIRMDLILEAIDVWQRSPLIGWGPDQYALISKTGYYAHSNYFEILADFGLIGFFLFYLLHALLLVQGLHYGIRKRSPTHRRVLILLFLILILDVAQVSFTSKYSWIFLGLTASMVTAPCTLTQKVQAPLTRWNRLSPAR
jgi:O-antigen ligase